MRLSFIVVLIFFHVASYADNEKQTGKMIYEQNCMVCHQDGVAGAPRMGSKDDWAPRLGKKNKEALTASAIKGLNAMPAKGTCTECGEVDILAAINYMIQGDHD